MRANLFSLWLGSFLFLTATTSFGQNSVLENKVAALQLSGAVFEKHIDLFAAAAPRKNPQNEVQRQAQPLRLNPETLHTIMSGHAEALTLTLPYHGEVLTVEMYQENVITDDFTVKTGPWETQHYTAGLYYRGIIQGIPHSLVAISFFDDEVIGVLSHPDWGNLNLGRLEHPGKNTDYTLYSDRYLPPPPFADCVVRDPGHHDLPVTDVPENVAGCVRIFFEADYALFLNKGSVSGTVNYVSGFFNVISTIYGNEQVTIKLSQVYVWTTPDSYSTTSSGDALDEFRDFRSSFDGDLAHLAALGGSNLGGVAYLNVLCSNSFNYGYSNINASYQNYPTYSWTINVVAHELGHNFSSNHTHWCGWPGGAIDNCGPTAGYGYETPPTCSNAPTPTGGGTIMSYCHLVGGVGVNLANGFGPLPRAAIQNATSSALSSGCIVSSCPTATCTAPTALTVGSLTTTSAVIGWNSTSGATAYRLQYRLVQTSGWTTVSNVTSPYTLSGLSPASQYEVQVQAVCGASSSAYTTGLIFKTQTSACAEPSDLTAATVTGTSVSLNWTENGGATSWDVQYGTAGFGIGSGTTVQVTSRPYVLAGLSIGTIYNYYVRATCGGANGNSTWVGPFTFSTPFQNDLVGSAVNIIVNAACPGTNIYSNEGATATGEFSPIPANGGYWGTGANNTVWFKFTAPASGSVQITTDLSPLGTLEDTQIALYNTSSPTSGVSHLLFSNEDGGTLALGYATLGYYSGLTPGSVYYVQVDGWQNDVGTFCIEVHEQFALPEPASCSSYAQTVVNGSTAPNKWFNIYTQPDAGTIGLPVAAIKSSVNLGTVTVQEILNPTVPATPSGARYMQRYYNFECTANAGAAKQVRLFFADSELEALKTATGQGSATAEDLNISHYDGINEDCTPTGNGSSTYSLINAVSATEIGSSGYFYLEFSSPTFSEMGAVLSLSPLPVELVSFSGNVTGNSNVLSWTTASEKNVAKFIVQRSADGLGAWQNVGSSLPVSSLNGQRNYTCVDHQPFLQGYYRLAIEDLDGSVQYSNILLLERSVPDGIQSVVPNPAQQNIYVAYQSTQEQTLRFRIIGADSRLVLEQAIEIGKGLNLLPFSVVDLPAGLYFCLTNGSDGLPFVKN